ncbi:U11/U12 small nuclear ribonucleoprotein 48 kDa protein, partial [Frankliniella fusca]
PGCEASSTAAAPGPSTPKTSERLLTDLTPAERSALHEYVIATTRKDGAPGDALLAADLHLPLGEGSKHSRPKTKLELLAEQRDAKRRRMNHKKVHTSRKTHTEVLREVIRNQMEYLMAQDTPKDLDT